MRVYKTVSLLVRLKSQVTIGNPYGQHSGYLHQAPIDQPVLARNCQMQLLDSWEAHSKGPDPERQRDTTRYVHGDEDEMLDRTHALLPKTPANRRLLPHTTTIPACLVFSIAA